MPISVQRDSDPRAIRLQGVIDVRCAAELKAALLDALALGAAIRLRFDDSTELDGTAVQLLVAAECAARSADLSWTVQGGWPESLAASLRDAGFARLPFEPDAQ